MKKRKRWKVKNTKKFHSVFEFWWKNENDEKSKTLRNFIVFLNFDEKTKKSNFRQTSKTHWNFIVFFNFDEKTKNMIFVFSSKFKNTKKFQCENGKSNLKTRNFVTVQMRWKWFFSPSKNEIRKCTDAVFLIFGKSWFWGSKVQHTK